MARTIGILSLKGGVGKTSSVIALGSALADFGKKVLLVDANFSSPNLGLHLNFLEVGPTLCDVLNRSANMRDAIFNCGNFDAVFLPIYSNIRVNPFKLKDKISPVKREYDFIIIDSSPALNEETLAAIVASEEIFVVTTPDVPSLGTTLRAIKIAKQRGTKISGLILNKVHNKNFEISLEDIEKTTDIPVVAVIPYDTRVLKAQSRFVSLIHYKPKSRASREYKKLAASLAGEKYNEFNLRDLFMKRKEDLNREALYREVFSVV